ncbi:MAG TPA: hypothetical protein PK798_07070 [Flavobacteriales bacterium]|nr:hypothetical protein [Flavobacteriales bacterium]HRJ38533.1 hypothetical protein [Flavobacteriales bacterium]
MKIRITIAFNLLVFIQLFGQENIPLANEIGNSWMEHLNKLDVGFHTSVRPYLATEFNTTRPFSCFSGTKNHYWNAGLQWKPNDSDSTFPTHGFYVQPHFRAILQSDIANDTSYFGRGLGAGITYTNRNKFAANFSFVTDNSPYPEYLRPSISAGNAIPGMGYAHPTNEGYAFTAFSGYASWSPHKIFNFQAGSGKHFFGDGYRSLLISDNAYNYPYLRMSATFWQIKYVVLYSMMNDLGASQGDPKQFRRKYATTHFLNWNISRRFSLGIFETVVWQAKDSLLNRQFDVNYLNPFVFFRPVEYAQGSADNVLMGLNAKLKITDHYQIYGQFILDEFLLNEMRADSGWWANKYGYQLGAKSFSPFGLKNLYLQTEYNFVRPFTYSHRSVVQNWGHMGSPLAHPYGANFREWINIGRFTYKRFQFEETFLWTIYGLDTGSVSWGGDPFKSYSQRARNYHNHVGQGQRNEVLFHQFRISWIVSPTWNARVFIGHQYRKQQTDLGIHETHMLVFGLSSWLWNQYIDR